MSKDLDILLVSTFEGGFQPITIASASAALLEAGHKVSVLDTYVDGIQEDRLAGHDLVGISIPLFDALHPGIEMAERVKALSPETHVTFFGQYATINARRLLERVGDSCVQGEWEPPLTDLAKSLSNGARGNGQPLNIYGLVEAAHGNGTDSIPKLLRHPFGVPSRHVLPPPQKYPQRHVDKLVGSPQVVGSTEVTRGCHHKCRYCSVFAAYDGKVLLIPEDVIVADVANQVAEGITHLTFIDAEFFNAKHHGVKLLRRLHEEFPELTFDFTTRVDHILVEKPVIEEMYDLGVRFITSALEFPNQKVLDVVVKEITVADIEEMIAFLRSVGITLNPTFIMFNPWITLEDLARFEEWVERNDLGEAIEPIQYETRLHLYKGSPLLSDPTVQSLEKTEHEFHYDWKHPDPRVDQLYEESVTPPEEGVFKRCCLKC